MTTLMNLIWIWLLKNYTKQLKNINLDFSNNVLKINVEEIIIQSLVFEGIKKQSLIEKKDILIQENHLLSKVKLKKIEIEL